MSLMHWWWIAAFVLIAAEIVLPGFFLLWIGLAAAGVGGLLLLFPQMPLLLQVIVFVLLSFAACLGYWRLSRGARAGDPASTLNRRAEQLIGQRYVLASAIENGRGKALGGDAGGGGAGPALPAGARVAVIGVDGATLQVRAAD